MIQGDDPTWKLVCAIAALFLASASTVPADTATMSIHEGDPDRVTVPDTLRGANATYAFTFERFPPPDPVYEGVQTEGEGTLEWHIEATGKTQDALGQTQPARLHETKVENVAEFPNHEGGWQGIKGDITYALDPGSGTLEQLFTDVEMQAPGHAETTTARLETEHHLIEGADIGLPLFAAFPISFLDALPGETFEEGEHRINGPGPALFTTTGTITDGVIPVNFVLPPHGPSEVAGTVYLDEATGFPQQLTLEYYALEDARLAGVVDLERIAFTTGDPLPQDPDPFKHPDQDSNAQFAPPITTGDREPSHTLEPTAEAALDEAQTSPILSQYEEDHEGTFLMTLSHAREANGPEHLAPSQAGLERGYDHHWISTWYAKGTPDEAVTVWVRTDDEGQLEIFSEQTSPIPPLQRFAHEPTQTLTISSAVERAENAHPVLGHDGANLADFNPAATAFMVPLYTYVAPQNQWVIANGFDDVDVDALLEGDAKTGLGLLNSATSRLGTELGPCDYFLPPSEGAAASVDGGTGLVVATWQLTYEPSTIDVDEGPPKSTACLSPEEETDQVMNTTNRSPEPGAIQPPAKTAQTYLNTSFTPQDPIQIRSDEALAEHPAVTRGSGTAQDPYVIEGWNIRHGPESMQETGILLANTQRHVTIQNNVIHGASGTGVQVFNAENVRILDNTILGSTFDADLPVGEATGGASKGIHIVDAADIIIEDNRVHDHQAASVHVQGSHEVDVAMNTLSSIRGASVLIDEANHTTVEGNAMTLDESTGVEARAPTSLRVSNNTMEGIGMGLDAVQAEGLLVGGNHVDLDGGIGLRLQGGTGLGILGNNISGASPGLTVEPLADRTGTTHVEGLTVDDNTFQAPSRGVAIWYLDTPDASQGVANEFRANTVEGGHWGLYAGEAQNLALMENTYRGQDVSVYLEGGQGHQLDAERFTQARHVGLHVEAATDVSLERAVFGDNEGHGLLAMLDAHVTVNGTGFLENQRGVVALDGAHVTVSNSTLKGNQAFGAYEHRGTLVAEGNWWGSPDGPGGCAAGAGDAVSCEVIYQEWRPHPP